MDALPLCDNCRREVAYWLAQPKINETEVTVALCDGCYRHLKTVEGKIRQGIPIHDYRPHVDLETINKIRKP